MFLQPVSRLQHQSQSCSAQRVWKHETLMRATGVVGSVFCFPWPVVVSPPCGAAALQVQVSFFPLRCPIVSCPSAVAHRLASAPPGASVEAPATVPAYVGSASAHASQGPPSWQGRRPLAAPRQAAGARSACCHQPGAEFGVGWRLRPNSSSLRPAGLQLNAQHM